MKTTPLLLLLGLSLVACTQHGNEHNDAMLKKVVDTDAEDIDDSSMVEQATRLDSFLEVKNGAKNGVLRGQSQQEKRRLTRAQTRGRARGRRGGSHVDTYIGTADHKLFLNSRTLGTAPQNIHKQKPMRPNGRRGNSPIPNTQYSPKIYVRGSRY